MTHNLSHQDHLVGENLSPVLDAIEIHATGDAPAEFIPAVPGDGVRAGALQSINQGNNFTACYIIDFW